MAMMNDQDIETLVSLLEKNGGPLAMQARQTIVELYTKVELLESVLVKTIDMIEPIVNDKRNKIDCKFGM